MALLHKVFGYWENIPGWAYLDFTMLDIQSKLIPDPVSCYLQLRVLLSVPFSCILTGYGTTYWIFWLRLNNQSIECI